MTQRLLNKAELEARSAFRHQLRRFERSGEQVARAHGITFAQYLLLLHVEGAPGRSWAHVNELAERLQLEHHSTVGLVSRCEAAGLAERRASAEDRRRVQVHCTRKGRAAVQAIAAALEDEVASLFAHVVVRPRRAAGRP
jgi:DNA-binding MarR family transcriptional regulator